MNTGKCPKCNALIRSVEVEAIDVTEALKPEWKGASFVCPFCRTILGVGIDPIAVKIDLVNEIVEKLRGR